MLAQKKKAVLAERCWCRYPISWRAHWCPTVVDPFDWKEGDDKSLVEKTESFRWWVPMFCPVCGKHIFLKGRKMIWIKRPDDELFEAIIEKRRIEREKRRITIENRSRNRVEP